jgi:hypothetical protein
MTTDPKENAMTDPTPIPPVPVLPTVWNVETVVTFGGSVALFVLGVLTASHVTVPAHLSDDVSAVVGALTSIAGVVTGLLAYLSKNKVTTAAINAAVR